MLALSGPSGVACGMLFCLEMRFSFARRLPTGGSIAGGSGPRLLVVILPVVCFMPSPTAASEGAVGAGSEGRRASSSLGNRAVYDKVVERVNELRPDECFRLRDRVSDRRLFGGGIFRVERKPFGKGGYARVHRARDTRSNEKLVFKRYPGSSLQGYEHDRALFYYELAMTDYLTLERAYDMPRIRACHSWEMHFVKDYLHGLTGAEVGRDLEPEMATALEGSRRIEQRRVQTLAKGFEDWLEKTNGGRVKRSKCELPKYCLQNAPNTFISNDFHKPENWMLVPQHQEHVLRWVLHDP